MELKYVVHPGMVKSAKDGKLRFIPAQYLILWYGADPRECLELSRSWHPDVYAAVAKQAEEARLIPLYPREDGNYTLPAADCG